MAAERVLELRIGDLLDHLGQRLRDALLGIQNVLEGVHEEVIEILDRLGEETHDFGPCYGVGRTTIFRCVRQSDDSDVEDGQESRLKP
jgi:hypothetical protein